MKHITDAEKRQFKELFGFDMPTGVGEAFGEETEYIKIKDVKEKMIEEEHGHIIDKNNGSLRENVRQIYGKDAVLLIDSLLGV